MLQYPVHVLLRISLATLLLNMSATTYTVKKNLRKQIRSSLKSLTPQQLSQQSALVWDRLFELPQYKSSENIGLFLSMPKGEIRTDEACARVLSEGKTLFVPRVGLDFEQCDMDLIRVPSKDIRPDLHSVSEDNELFYKDWPRNKWGIPEAPTSQEYEIAKPGDIDLLIVPGLGFDANGGRLGQGKGYYDRFIQSMRNDGKGKPLLVAVGLEPSFVKKGIPMMDHDFRMDLVVLPNECYDTMEQNGEEK